MRPTWLLHLVLVAATAWLPTLGAPVWHHLASLALSAVLLGVLGRGRLTERRFLGVQVLWWTALAIVSGFLILYLKQELKDWDLKDWAKWWHIFWSWMALLLFVLHTWVNRKGLARAWRHQTSGHKGPLLYGVLGLIVASIVATWGRPEWFTDAGYIPLTLVSWLVILVPSYGTFLATLVARRLGRVPAWLGRVQWQNLVTVWLLPATLLANLSGFPLTFFGTKHTVYKYVAKIWHTWPSIAMTVLVFAHTVQFLPGMAHYLRPKPTA